MNKHAYERKKIILERDYKSLSDIFEIAKEIANTNNKNLSKMRGEDPNTQRLAMLIPVERTEEERRKLSIIGY